MAEEPGGLQELLSASAPDETTFPEFLERLGVSVGQQPDTEAKADSSPDDLLHQLLDTINHAQKQPQEQNEKVSAQSLFAQSDPVRGNLLSQLLGTLPFSEGTSGASGSLPGISGTGDFGTQGEQHSGERQSAGGSFDPAAMAAMFELIEQLKRPDPGEELLQALRPYLGKRRRARIQQASQLLRISRLLPLLGGEAGGGLSHLFSVLGRRTGR